MKIGFTDYKKNDCATEENTTKVRTAKTDEIAQEQPVKSVVEVSFSNGNTYSYFNDLFDLKVGDEVFVDGQLAGNLGIVMSVTKHFKISLDSYKKVLSRADKNFHGKFYQTGFGMTCFEQDVLPIEQVCGWFFPPTTDEDSKEFEIGDEDDFIIDLDDLENNVLLTKSIAQKAQDILAESGIEYISIKDGKGFAIVNGNSSYRLDFTIDNHIVKNLYCDCMYPSICKHCFALLLFLRVYIKDIEENYTEEYEKTNSITFISRSEFFNAISSNDGTITV